MSNLTKDQLNSNLILFAIAGVVACANVLFSTNLMVSLGIVALEIMVLLYLFSKNLMVDYFGFYLMFLGLSFEYGSFLGIDEFYGFKNFRVLGMNLGIVMLLPMLLKFLTGKYKLEDIKAQKGLLFNFCIWLFFASVMAVFTGIFNLIINDNNITQMSNYLKLFLGNIYELGIFPLLISIAFINMALDKNSNLNKLRDYLFAVLFGGIVAMIVSFLTNNYGTYGGVITLMVPNLVNFLPFFGAMVFYKDRIILKPVMIVGYLVGMCLLYKFNASGKLILILILLPVLILFALKYQKKGYTQIIIALMIPIAILAGGMTLNRSDENILFQSKLKQATALIDVFDKNWYKNLPESPKFRVSEFGNTFFEYCESPLYLMFGKGYLGTIEDHLDEFNYSDGAFSDEQWDNKSFYALHSSINTLFLTYGLVGMIFYLYIIWLFLTKLIKTQWGVVGAYWFLIYFGYSITLSAFGMAALLFSLWELDNKKYISGERLRME